MPSAANSRLPKRTVRTLGARIKKERAKKAAETQNKITKEAASRGARVGLRPTSGRGAPISNKKARKLERKLGHALKRKVETEGDVAMRGNKNDIHRPLQEEAVLTPSVADITTTKGKKGESTAEAEADMVL